MILWVLQRTVLDAQRVRVEGVTATGVELTVAGVAGDCGGDWRWSRRRRVGELLQCCYATFHVEWTGHETPLHTPSLASPTIRIEPRTFYFISYALKYSPPTKEINTMHTTSRRFIPGMMFMVKMLAMSLSFYFKTINQRFL